MTTTTAPLPAPPAWAASSEGGISGSYAWATYLSDAAKLRSTGRGGQLIAEGWLWQLNETGEPPQAFLRLVGAEDGSEEIDLTAAEADEFLAAAALWLDKLRGLRAQMGGA